MITYDDYTMVHEKLADVVASSEAPPAWLEAWHHSKRGRTDATFDPRDLAGSQEYLALWKAVRASGVLPGEASFSLVADEVRALAEPRLAGIHVEFDRERDRLYEGLLRAYGEEEMARLHQTDREAFDARTAAGRAYFVTEWTRPKGGPRG